ncbi:glutamate receptor ionotropic, delta-2-like [Centruroides vittatus]|uniref:glutamate receptor ionotropic, delta-2-like n=1 Tax=Centruroides vittatus TaxID=120091 RepID=UPI003510B189
MRVGKHLTIILIRNNKYFKLEVSNDSYVWRVAGTVDSLFMTYDETKNQITGGKLFPLFKVIQEKLKFSYIIVHPIEKAIGYKDKSGKWYGITRQVANQEADVAFIPVVVNHERFSAMEFTSVFSFYSTVFLIRAPDKVFDWNAVTKPFTLNVWIATFSIVLIFGLTLYKVLEKEFIDAETGKRWTLRTVFWNLVCTFLGKGLNLEQVKRLASRFMIGIWWLSIVVLVSSYSGALMSFMTCPLTESFPRDFQELAVFVRNGEYSCGTYKGFAIWKEIKICLL